MLDVRAKFQSGPQPATLADLYDPLTMPPELLKAHQKLDAAVDKAFEASGGNLNFEQGEPGLLSTLSPCICYSFGSCLCIFCGR